MLGMISGGIAGQQNVIFKALAETIKTAFSGTGVASPFMSWEPYVGC